MLGDAVNTAAANGNIIDEDLHDMPIREEFLDRLAGFIIRSDAITRHNNSTVDHVQIDVGITELVATCDGITGCGDPDQLKFSALGVYLQVRSCKAHSAGILKPSCLGVVDVTSRDSVLNKAMRCVRLGRPPLSRH